MSIIMIGLLANGVYLVYRCSDD